MHKFFAKPLFLGKKVICLAQCHSTNDFLLTQVSRTDMIEGTVVVTADQTHGRGQRGNIWIAEPGKNITCSILLEPKFLSVKDQFGLTLLTSLALRDVVSNYVNGVSIKWPNDIYVNSDKIGGILIENTIKSNKIEYAVIGIGLNINQKGFSLPTATSLAMKTNTQYDLDDVLEQVLVRLEYWYLKLKSTGFSSLKSEYLNHLYWINEDHEFESHDQEIIKGKIIGVDPFGRIILKTDSGQRSYELKELVFKK